MISKRIFVQIIKNLEREINKHEEINFVLNKYGFILGEILDYTLFNSILEMIYEIFGQYEDIDYWIFTLDFGKNDDINYIKMYNSITKTDIIVNTPELLYDYLINIKK